MIDRIKSVLITLFIFLALVSISPMLSSSVGCGGAPLTQGGCAPVTTRRIVFPVYRTVVCKLWSQPNCAPDTLLPGWHVNLMNIENAVILGLLVIAAMKIRQAVYRD